jgi:hypothetical protein
MTTPFQSYTCTTRADTHSIAQFCCGTIESATYAEADKSCTFTAAGVDAFQVCVDHYEKGYAWKCTSPDGGRCEGQYQKKSCTGGSYGVVSGASPRGGKGKVGLALLVLVLGMALC